MYDRKCLDLAEVFIGNSPEWAQQQLAQTIQTCIEEWINEHREELHESDQ